MEPTIVLIPSPLLGPATWEPTARALERRGRSVTVPSLECVSRSAPPYWPAGVEAIVRAVGSESAVLVPHSNSGLYVPAVIDELRDLVRAVVYVDAALPGAGFHARRDFLNTLAGESGDLPVWTSWWDPSDVAELFPDPEVQARVEAEQVRMPVGYYDHLPPAPNGRARPPCGFIWFAEPYDTGAARAAADGWPTRHLPGKHLHMLVEPDVVAAAVLEMVAVLRGT